MTKVVIQEFLSFYILLYFNICDFVYLVLDFNCELYLLKRSKHLRIILTFFARGDVKQEWNEPIPRPIPMTNVVPITLETLEVFTKSELIYS